MLTPFVKPRDILNLAVQNVFLRVYTYNPLLQPIMGRPRLINLMGEKHSP